ncbi:retrovirus-related Pol polyprotein from transposon opus [Trichonephila clavipes]|nr:retrovirus-related Pol polyprotein from transposon opus [Trichonephila clavipes]
MDFAQLKEALTRMFPVVRNRKDLEVKFYLAHQGRCQEPSDFIYDLLKVHKKLGLKMSEDALVEHIFARPKPQVQDYVEKNSLVNVALYHIHHIWHYRVRFRESGQPIGRLRKTYKPGLAHVLYHEIDTGDKPPVVSRAYRYDWVKQSILDYVEKKLKVGTKIPIQSPYASLVVLYRKNSELPPDNPEAYRFAVDYRKLNAITEYPRYPLPLIEDLITNIPHTEIMSSLDLHSGFFKFAVNPSDVAFVTKHGTYGFTCMPFGLSGASPNFQKAIDIILKPVIGWFVSVYMDDGVYIAGGYIVSVYCIAIVCSPC